MTPIQVISAILFLIAGGGVFLVLLNRILLPMKDGRPKTISILLTGFLFTAGSALFGYHVGNSSWIWIPVLILFGLTLGEVRRVMLRVRYRGTPPIERIHGDLSLRRPLTHFDLHVARYEVPHDTWHAPPVRIVHISDLHVSQCYPDPFYHQLFAHIQEAKPDILVITGDFVTNAMALPRLPGILTPLAQQYRTFAILGNHDYWAGAEKVADVVRSSGIALLRNTEHALGQKEGGTIRMYGYEYPWGAKHINLSANPTDGVNIVLTHTPDNVYQLSRKGAMMVFAGHYHAGQIRLPYLGSLVIPSRYGRRFDHGHFVVHGTHLFVTSGIGTATFPIRVYCQPDIFIVDIVGTDKSQHVR